MGDSVVAITAGSGTNVSTRTNASAEHMQVFVVGIDGSNSVVPADATNGLAVDVKAVAGTVTVTGTVTVNSSVTGAIDLHVSATTTATQFAANACKGFLVTAEAGNTAEVVIGASTVVAAAATQRGTPLAAGDTAFFAVPNTNILYHRSSTGTQNLTLTILT